MVEPAEDVLTETLAGVQQQRRRRLLKGLVSGAGVPVILTLSSGAALAASSNKSCIDTTLTYDKDNLRCIANATVESVAERREARVGTYFNDTTDNMTGGTGADSDLCLIYHDPSTGAPFVGPTIGNSWGNDGGDAGTNIRITESCWNSFIV